ncbi:hypothetical protein [Nostoc sp.]|uniref:hypothetical protein n=1 Tax=Nostoc sp. TaxID=1180 RepID=UPI002FF86C5A
MVYLPENSCKCRDKLVYVTNSFAHFRECNHRITYRCCARSQTFKRECNLDEKIAKFQPSAFLDQEHQPQVAS